MTTPYKEGDTWSVRSRSKRNPFYQCGFDTQKAAQKWLNTQAQSQSLQLLGKPWGLGPHKTTLAHALYDYALKVLPYKKGAVQETSRVNKYLRVANLATLKAEPHTPATTDLEMPSTSDSKTRNAKRETVRYFNFKTVPANTQRVIPKGLSGHRKTQEQSRKASDSLRKQLAHMAVADFATHHIQALIDKLMDDGFKPATVHLERALLREFFGYAKNNWHWAQPLTNPASGLTMPIIDNARDRVLSIEEQSRLELSLAQNQNKYITPCIAFLIETAMRQAELIVTATWNTVDWENRLLKLPDAKAGSRDVPLTQSAMRILKDLPRGAPDAPVFPMSLEALKAGWNRAVIRAGLEDLKLHDLRHTAATRMALRLNGNIFLLKLITGHKTLSQLERYVNLKASDAVKALDATEDAASCPTPSPTALHSDQSIAAQRENVYSLAAARARRAA